MDNLQTLYFLANDLDKFIASTSSNSGGGYLLQYLDSAKSNEPSQKKLKAYQQGPKKRLVHTEAISHAIKKWSTKKCLT